MPEIIINGPEGRIEARFHQSSQPDAPTAIVLHPHPEHGGTMNNKVVYTAYRAFVDLGFHVIRFNFRGVGRSEGKFDFGEGELRDAASVLDWFQGQMPRSRGCWVAGFSFGAWIAMQLLMRRPEVEGFIAISPPANMYDFNFLAPCPCSGLFIQGTQDAVVSADSVVQLAGKLTSQRGILVECSLIQGADHFFGNHIDTLSSHITRYVGGFLDNRRAVVNG